ncbi:MAG: cupin domain-containing protein [Nitrospiraceae bacterium]|nr:MAG: cupin domain-containing protein [Nitrospiraceae bacterium]
MKNLILDVEKFKNFTDEKYYKGLLWEGNTSRIMLICLKPGQEIKPHVHKGDHIWLVLEGSGEFLCSSAEPRVIDSGKIVVAPDGADHGIRNHTKENLVFASITV